MKYTEWIMGQEDKDPGVTKRRHYIELVLLCPQASREIRVERAAMGSRRSTVPIQSQFQEQLRQRLAVIPALREKVWNRLIALVYVHKAHVLVVPAA